MFAKNILQRTCGKGTCAKELVQIKTKQHVAKDTMQRNVANQILQRISCKLNLAKEMLQRKFCIESEGPPNLHMSPREGSPGGSESPSDLLWVLRGGRARESQGSPWRPQAPPPGQGMSRGISGVP